MYLAAAVSCLLSVHSWNGFSTAAVVGEALVSYVLIVPYYATRNRLGGWDVVRIHVVTGLGMPPVNETMLWNEN